MIYTKDFDFCSMNCEDPYMLNDTSNTSSADSNLTRVQEIKSELNTLAETRSDLINKSNNIEIMRDTLEPWNSRNNTDLNRILDRIETDNLNEINAITQQELRLNEELQTLEASHVTNNETQTRDSDRG